MRNIRYLIDDKFKASSVAKDLRVQLDVNRLTHVSITSVDHRNEVIVQVPEANEQLEEVLGSFMQDYNTGTILE